MSSNLLQFQTARGRSHPELMKTYVMNFLKKYNSFQKHVLTRWRYVCVCVYVCVLYTFILTNDFRE